MQITLHNYVLHTLETVDTATLSDAEAKALIPQDARTRGIYEAARWRGASVEVALNQAQLARFDMHRR